MDNARLKAIDKVVCMTHPHHLEKQKDARFIKEITKSRKLHVCFEAPRTGRYRATCKCKGCMHLRYKMCDGYHQKKGEYWDITPLEAQTEIAMRIVYEVVFGFRPLKHVTHGVWLNQCGKTKKSSRHHRRVKDLMTIAMKDDTWYYPFLRI